MSHESKEERALREYGVGSMREFLLAESEPETELARVARISQGERTCCVDPDCPVWSDDWLEKPSKQVVVLDCGHVEFADGRCATIGCRNVRRDL